MLKNMDSSENDSPNVIILDDSSYSSQIKKGITLIDFWAPWCMPCKIQGPIINELADELVGKANICKINIDDNKAAASKFGIRSIPTILIFSNGEVVKQLNGVKSKAALKKSIDSYL